MGHDGIYKIADMRVNGRKSWEKKHGSTTYRLYSDDHGRYVINDEKDMHGSKKNDSIMSTLPHDNKKPFHVKWGKFAPGAVSEPNIMKWGKVKLPSWGRVSPSWPTMLIEDAKHYNF